MAASVITVAQQKGGAGKTTLAIHLGVAFAALGRRTALLDIDPQASLTNWDRLRGERHPDRVAAPTVSAVTGWRASGEIDRLKRDAELIVVDSPPHADTEAKIVIRAASLVVVPIQPSVMDLWATRATLEIAKSERVPVLLVLNRVPPRSSVADEIIGEAGKLGVPVATAMIGNRVALAAAINKGLGIHEHQSSSVAAKEIEALAEEILALVGRP